MASHDKEGAMIKLKKWEREILLHRLVLTDCLLEVLGTYHNEENEGEFKGFPADKLATALEMQLSTVELGFLDVSVLNPEIEKEILAECLEGSTWFAGHDEAIATGELHRSMGQRHIKAALNLETMITEIAGRTVSIQWH
jgi:hypothetical protein